MAVFEGLAVLAAKVASASTVVQATAGLGIAVAGVTGAGAAGILPGSLQDGVAGAIESVSPFDLPDSADHGITPAREIRDSGVDGPGDVPGVDPIDVPAPITSSTPAAETTDSPEPGDDGGVHQHPGGAVQTDAPRTDNSGPGSVTSGRDHEEDDGPTAGSSSPASHSAEDEDHEDDHSGHGGGDSGDDDSGDDSGDDSSGHGGSDDD